jgi:hypothetical protein
MEEKKKQKCVSLTQRTKRASFHNKKNTISAFSSLFFIIFQTISLEEFIFE